MIKGGTPSTQAEIRTHLSPGYQLSWPPFPRKKVLRGSEPCPQSFTLSLPDLFLSVVFIGKDDSSSYFA